MEDIVDTRHELRRIFTLNWWAMYAITTTTTTTILLCFSFYVVHRKCKL